LQKAKHWLPVKVVHLMKKNQGLKAIRFYYTLCVVRALLAVVLIEMLS
jgi:hypothetical protein